MMMMMMMMMMMSSGAWPLGHFLDPPRLYYAAIKGNPHRCKPAYCILSLPYE